MKSKAAPHGVYENATLLSRIIQGDEAAFRIFFDKYYQKLFHLAVYFLRTKELGEEAVSDVFLALWKKRDTLDGVQDIEKYLYIAVKNQALHYIRRSTLPDHEPIDLYRIEQIHDTDNPELSLLNQEYMELIQSAIDSLPDKCKEVFRLGLSDKLKQQEIAQLLNISIKTVEAHMATAYKRIALYVNKEYGTTTKTNRLLTFFF
ncbi:DNA-directed RNA polymerase sigma-70 factor [Bacteroidia bacterium]|nr:DNA-directed RNA polymerase sigma-70 factor [Bacteroidia bacterium]